MWDNTVDSIYNRVFYNIVCQCYSGVGVIRTKCVAFAYNFGAASSI